VWIIGGMKVAGKNRSEKFAVPFLSLQIAHGVNGDQSEPER
jgi:hypothetical protein